ncbi:MAG: hypothetical protein J5827_03690 [Oscillospiraceae bacterium]|nr:hypothetical protein [Oscillospiraceae bacterium]
MSSLPLETERKFLIAMPDPELLDRLGFSRISITQTYLLCRDEGVSSRVRRSVENGLTSYTATEKRRITDITRVEAERSISAEEYGRLLALADPSLKVIEKLRRTAEYDGLLLEIDIYPFWSDRAILETELPFADRPVRLPEYIRVIREVSSDKRYTNRSLAAEVPYDSI